MDLYFISLNFFAIIFLMAGLINTVSIKYYESESYNGPGANQTTAFLLQGSAVCTNTAWVVCQDCQKDQWRLDKSRFATAVDGTVLVLRNLCRGATAVNGIANFVTFMFLLVSSFIFSHYLRMREIRFDEGKLTITDYSIVIGNPPHDASNPDDWRDFFEQFTPDNEDQVKIVTIALNNEELIRKLIQRRILRRKLREILREGVDLNDDASVQIEIVRYNLERAEEKVGLLGRLYVKSPEKLMSKINALTEEIKEMQQKRYGVSKVFVTFETEVTQRTSLKAWTVGRLDVYWNNTKRMVPGLFQGKVLDVKEPCKPNGVGWLDLSAGQLTKLKGSILTLTLTCGILGAAIVGITSARSAIGPSLAGPLTCICNVLIPHIIKFMRKLETHST
jgi:hypothetical protein